MAGETVVGEPVYNGVLSRPRANPSGSCPGSIAGNDRPQALWVFSSDACGVYDIPHLKIEHAGKTNPIGEIVLTSNDGALNLPSGSGMLLRVTATELSR